MRVFFTLILLAVLAAGGWLAWALLVPVTPDGQKFVLLRQGYSTRHIASELKSAGVIRSADAFVLWHSFHRKRSLKAGEYLFENTADTRQVHDRLAKGDVYFREVVIPEGFTMFDIAQAVQDAGLGSSQDFLKAATSDTALIADLAPDAKSLEGYLFPATYEFTRTQSADDMVAAMVKEFRRQAREIGLTGEAQGNEVARIVDPGLHYREGDGSAGRAAGRGQRLLQPRGAKHRVAGRSQRDLRGDVARNVPGRIASRRHARRFSV